MGMEKETALRVSSAFGAGLGRMGELCGVVSGALMALGLRYGWSEPGDAAGKERVYSKAREFAARFKERNGSLTCRDLIGCDMSTPEGFAEARRKNIHTKVCPKFVRDACEILEESGI